MPDFRSCDARLEAAREPTASADKKGRRPAGAVPFRRRDVLLGMAAVGAFGGGRAYAQAGKKNWAAVVIGVDHAADLPVLRAAVSGAKDMAKWLDKQGYDVTTFTDEVGPVKTQAILDAITKTLDPPRYTRLLVYFAGHGFASQRSEFWMLSEAQRFDNEAINLDGSALRARFAPIGNVVFISDACRSRPSDFRTDTINGGIIFPKDRPRKVTADVDQFFATQIGDTDLEASLTESVKDFHGIYTQSFLSAFDNPPSGFVIPEDGQQVVPDRNLKRYLMNDVPRRAQALSLTLRQYPDAIVTSPDTVYLGRIAGAGTSAPASPGPGSVSNNPGQLTGGTNSIVNNPGQIFGGPNSIFHTPGQIIRWPNSIINNQGEIAGGFDSVVPGILPPATTKELATLGMRSASDQVPLELAPEFQSLGRTSGYFATHDMVVNSAALHDDFPGRTGFIVSNTGVKQIAVTPGAKIEILRGGSSSEPALVQVETGQARDTSALIEFEDGSGTVLAVLPDFVGSIAVQKGGVVSVSYSPSRQSGRWIDDASFQARLAQLRANATAAAKLGVFRADDSTEALRLANDIRVLKGVDPTLGLYAAYAYQQAGRLDQIRSIAEMMRGDLELILFDVAMLASDEPVQTVERGGFIVPFCPMLSQGWNFLEATDARIPEPARDAARHLRQALWTTFDPEGVAILLEGPLFRSNAG